MRIVHLARDDKFVPLMRSLFDEAFPGANRYLVARRRRATQRFVADADNIAFRTPLALRLGFGLADIDEADCIVAHSMTRMFLAALRRARPDALVVWIGWGYDYYPLLESRLGALTLDGGKHRRWAMSRRPALAAIAPRIDVCCVIPSELPLLREALPALRAQAHELPLFTVEDVFERGPTAMAGDDVLLGNSATSSNNHAEAIALLRGRLAEGARVVAPLSYGDAAYAERIVAIGREAFGERFDALRGWMPIDAYNERIRNCGFVVMNHRRQQAVGNIAAALYKGATVYLRRENPLYAFYQGLGATLRSVEELGSGSGPLVPLSEAERAANREVIGRHYRRARVVEAIRGLAGYRRP